MKIIDREEERKEFDKTPEGKKKKVIDKLITLVLIVIGIAILYLAGHHPFFIGTPHTVQIGDIAITPGDTRVGDLKGFGLSHGFSTSRTFVDDNLVEHFNLIDLSEEVEPRSYYIGFRLIKEDKVYGTLEIVNEETSAVSMAEAIVREVKISADMDEAAEAMIDGIAMSDISIEILTEKLGDPDDRTETTSAGETITAAIWKKGRYNLQIETKADGSVVSIAAHYERT